MNNPAPVSSFHILQQQAALMQQGENGIQVITTSASGSTVPSITAGLISSHSHHHASAESATNGIVHSGPILGLSSAVVDGLLNSASAATTTTMDHCNLSGGFHDGLAADVAFDNDEDYIDDAEELDSLEGAAFQSRMQPDEMSPEEVTAFPDVCEQHSLIPVYHFIRNSILKFWYQRPKVRTLKEEYILSNILFSVSN